nr:hypothetical protein [uncultured Campylobacter sp.]
MPSVLKVRLCLKPTCAWLRCTPSASHSHSLALSTETYDTSPGL